MHHSKTEEFLGIDVGSARIGISRGSGIARIAEPVITLQAENSIDKILELLKHNQTTGIVVGLPRSLTGHETEQTKSVRVWVEEAKSKIELPFYWQDEALTTEKAEKITSKKHDVDAKAAMLILQDFLDTARADRVRA